MTDPRHLCVAASLAAALLAAPSPAGVPAEAEPNDNVGLATALPTSANGARVRGNILPADVDYYSFTATLGDRVYAATMTQWTAASADTVIELIASDGGTVLEADDDNGSFSGTASSIAGAVIPADGTYYVRVIGFSPTTEVRPYDLYVRVQSGARTREVEPNDLTPQALPASGWINGVTSAAADRDRFSLDLVAGDTVFMSLDLDPERDSVSWNGQLGIGLFSGLFLAINDSGSVTPAFLPNSEAHFMTVKEAGEYAVEVRLPDGGINFGSYHLSVTVFPDNPGTGNVQTYASTDVPKTIVDGGVVTSTLTIPDNVRIGRVAVTIDLDHDFMSDLDVRLTSPAGNDVVLFTDIGSSAQTSMTMTLDDDAAIPIGSYSVVTGMRYQPDVSHRLEWFSGGLSAGTWTLTIHDDFAEDGGTLNAWSITVYEADEPTSCDRPDEGADVLLFASDFEADGGGFTHSGTFDEWERGTPSFAPITSAHSGANCWKTDLDNTYDASSTQDLLSPPIDLDGIDGPILLAWHQKFQLDTASNDHAFVEVREVGGANPRIVWQWTGPLMTQSVGAPTAVVIEESAGWALMHADISDFAGDMIEVRFHLDSNAVTQEAGLAIDDVVITACDEPCPGDVNNSGAVNVTDLLALIAVWGPAGGGGPADLDNSGVVNVTDLLALIANWGPC